MGNESFSKKITRQTSFSPGDKKCLFFDQERLPLVFLALPEPPLLPPEERSLGWGTLAPSFLASDKPMAIACLGLVTFLPLLPLRSSPLFISCIFSSTSFCDYFDYLAIKIKF